MDYDGIRRAVSQLLGALGVDRSSTDFFDTPSRVAGVYEELFEPRETSWTTFEEDYADMILFRGHEMWTLCPHHLLPVRLEVSIAYLPDGVVLGASKVLRALHEVNSAPKTQEVLTKEMVESLLEKCPCRGAAILIRGEHGCMRLRGVKTSSTMITLRFCGEFEEREELRRRFMDLVT